MKQGGKTWRVRVWRMAGLCAMVLAAYSNSFRGELVFDNAGVIAGDARIRAVTADNLGRIWAEPYSSKTSSGLYRPLTTLSYLANYVWLGNGTNPAGYHWVNLAIHAANTLLVYLLVALVLGSDGPAWATAALWGVHPLLTESVTNVVGRADLLAAFGVLAGLLCYIRRGSAAWLLAAQAVGIFSKESAIVLPGLMLLYDVTWPGRMAGTKRAMAYGSVLLPLVVFAVLRAQLPGNLAVLNTDNPLLLVGLFAARLRAIEVIGKYLGLFLWPARLSPDYSFNAVPVFGWQLNAVVAFALCAAAAAAVVHCYRARKQVFFFLAFFFVALLPVSNLLMRIGSIMAERFAYLPSVGLAACAIAAIYALAGLRGGSRGAMVTAVVAVLCVACAARTYARNFDWENDRSLWTSAVEAVPESAKAHYNLGTLLSDVPAQRAQAISELEAALRINPDKPDAHDNLGRLLIEDPARRGDAIAQWEAAVRIDPDMADAHKHLGEAFAVTPGRLPDAIAEFQVAARLQPDVAETHANLGTVLYQVGQLADSMAESQAAIRINPNLAEPHNTLGIALAQMGRIADAIPEFEAVLRIDPANAQASANLLKARAAMRASGPGERPR
jgi:protein O-mannosyl-transferase